MPGGVVFLTKLDAALRQLNAAITLLFDGFDAVAVHTLANAASVVLSDLVEHKGKHVHVVVAWDRLAQQANKLNPAEYYKVMRGAANFMKHAAGDPQEMLEFDATETDALLLWAVLNASEFPPLSPECQSFQFWHMARYAPDGLADQLPWVEAVALLGDLRTLPRTKALSVGQFLLQHMV